MFPLYFFQPCSYTHSPRCPTSPSSPPPLSPSHVSPLLSLPPALEGENWREWTSPVEIPYEIVRSSQLLISWDIYIDISCWGGKTRTIQHVDRNVYTNRHVLYTMNTIGKSRKQSYLVQYNIQHWQKMGEGAGRGNWNNGEACVTWIWDLVLWDLGFKRTNSTSFYWGLITCLLSA